MSAHYPLSLFNLKLNSICLTLTETYRCSLYTRLLISGMLKQASPYFHKKSRHDGNRTAAVT